MGQTTSNNTTNHKNKRKSISKLFHAQTGSIWFQIGSYLVPIGSYGFSSSQIGSYNVKWFPNCSPAHTLFQDRFKDVQVGPRWFSTLYILSPNFHFLESKANVLQLRKWDSVTFFAKTGAALTNSSTFASPEGTTVSHCHTINHC